MLSSTLAARLARQARRAPHTRYWVYYNITSLSAPHFLVPAATEIISPTGLRCFFMAALVKREIIGYNVIL